MSLKEGGGAHASSCVSVAHAASFLGGVVQWGGGGLVSLPAFCCRQAYNRTLKATFSIHTSPIPLLTENPPESHTGV